MALRTRAREQRLVTSVDWDGYVRCREALEHTNVRITYSRGVMELMSPSEEHEDSKTDLSHLLGAYLQESGIDYAGRGSTTFRNRPREQGLEPDECYYIGSNAPLRHAAPPPGRDMHPPDLALEVEVSRSALDRLDIFAGLGVREVWRYRYDRKKLVVHELQPDGRYVERESSGVLPDVPLRALEVFVERAARGTTGAAVAAFRKWLREGRPPLG